jgi:hypothetical protein
MDPIDNHGAETVLSPSEHTVEEEAREKEGTGT